MADPHAGEMKMQVWIDRDLYQRFLAILAKQESTLSLNIRGHVQRYVDEHEDRHKKKPR